MPRKRLVPAKMEEPVYVSPVKPTSQPSNLLLVLLIVVSFFAGYLFFKVKNLEQNKNTTTAQQPPAPPPVTIDQVKKLFSKGYTYFGDSKRKVLFVEVSDPSCPYCHIAGGQDPELSKEAGANFQYVTDGGTYKPPVTEMRKLVEQGKASYVQIYAPGHGNGQLATQAQYCAYDKDKFWEVHDKLMSKAGYDLINNTVKNDKANIPTLVSFLANEMDSNYLTSCLTTGKYEKNLTRDSQMAQTLGYQGTPHFIVNTTVFGGAQSWDTMDPVVKKLL